MTDAEIIKALECCSEYTHDCDNCPLDMAEESLCFNEIKRYALDLVNRQKAEIERLKEENHHFADIGKMYSEIRAEARKEFAEMLKETAISRKYRKDVVYIEEIDKEMAGDME